MLAEEITNWHWRQALQIAAQVPEIEKDAWIVLDCVQKLLLVCFEPRPPSPLNGDAQLLRFTGGSNSPRRRASSSGKASVLPK